MKTLQALCIGLVGIAAIAGAARTAPSNLELARQLARSGTLARLLPLVGNKETEELVAANADLSPADQRHLRQVAGQTFEQGLSRLMDAEAHIYATRLSRGDMLTLIERNRDPVSARYQAVLPAAIGAAMGAMEGSDFKRDVLTNYCAQTHKKCPTTDPSK